MKRIKDRITAEVFIKVCNESRSMMEAAARLRLHYNSFKKRALELNCFKTNQSGAGFSKVRREGHGKYSLNDILNGKHPGYHTYKLKNRLISEGILKNVCAVCGNRGVWNGKKLEMELDHIDGDRTNHSPENLKILCPNCHSQTDTFRSKNRVPKEKSLE